jgi:hypothetical protein
MVTFVLTLTLLLQIASSSELYCVGALRETPIPADVFIAGTREEGVTGVASEGELVYLNGPGLSTLKPGDKYRVIRPEGLLQDWETHNELGYYIKSLAIIRVERVEQDSAVATVVVTCQGIVKGDIVVPATPKLPVEFTGEMSNRLTPFPADGLVSVIILGEDDARELAKGQFCYIKAGLRDGVKAGDRFTVFRLPPPFEARDLKLTSSVALRSYRKMEVVSYQPQVFEMLRDRKIPPRAVGDIVVVEPGDAGSAARVVNSLVEIHPGDIVVRR